jgi:hypothetical protein
MVVVDVVVSALPGDSTCARGALSAVAFACACASPCGYAYRAARGCSAAGGRARSGVKWSSTRCRSRAPSSSQCSTAIHRPPSTIAPTRTRPPPTSTTAPLGPAAAQHALHVPEPSGAWRRDPRCRPASRPLPCASTRFPFWRVLRSRRMSEPVSELARANQGGGAGAAKCQSWLPIPHLAWQTDAAPSQPLAPPRAPVHGPSHPQSLAVAIARHHSAHVPSTQLHTHLYAVCCSCCCHHYCCHHVSLLSIFVYRLTP